MSGPTRPGIFASQVLQRIYGFDKCGFSRDINEDLAGLSAVLIGQFRGRGLHRSDH